MDLFEKPKRRRAHRRTKTWLDKHPEYGNELMDKIKDYPGVRAVIIKAATGIDFDREELEMMDPQSFFGLQTYLARKYGHDKRIPSPANDAAFFNAFAPDNSQTRRLIHFDDFDRDDSFPDMIPLNSEDSREAVQYYRPVLARRRPVPVRRLHTRQRVPAVHKSPVSPQSQGVDDLLRWLVKVIQETTASQAVPPKVYAVEVNGEFVEMSEAEYRDFCRKREEKRRLTEQTPSRPAGDKASGNSTIQPTSEASGDNPEPYDPPANPSPPQSSN